VTERELPEDRDGDARETSRLCGADRADRDGAGLRFAIREAADGGRRVVAKVIA